MPTSPESDRNWTEEVIRTFFPGFDGQGAAGSPPTEGKSDNLKQGE
jgi:hypothetical protein